MDRQTLFHRTLLATARGSSSIQTMKIAQNNGSEISNTITDNGSYFLLFGMKTLSFEISCE